MMRRKLIAVVVGGAIVGGITVGTISIAESAPAKRKADPAAVHRGKQVVGRGGVIAPAPPRPLGRQLELVPDTLSASAEGVAAQTQRDG
jgi:hypothetical protein